MSEYQQGLNQFMDEARLLGELERGVRAANQEIIHQAIPGLDRESVHGFAVSVARLRADYLAAAMRALNLENGTAVDPAVLNDLRIKRLAFNEALEAYEALRHAIERGYIDVSMMAADGDDAH